MSTTEAPPASPEVPHARRRILTFLLVLSGAAALLHQAAWFRLLRPVVGAGVLPAACVSAAVLLGLAVGSAWGGRLADRARRPLRVLVVAEIAAAGLGLLVPWGLVVLGDAIATLSPAAGRTVGIVGSVLGLGLVAVPMGVTLPAALRTLGIGGAGAGRAFKHLYGWNTLGAVAGVIAGGAFTLEWLGNRASAYTASALQALVALIALLGARYLGGAARAQASASAPSDGDPAEAGIRLPLAAALAGAAGLAVQVAWIRRIAPVAGNTTQAFAVVLGIWLLALALGSLLLGPRQGARGHRGALVVLGLAGILAAISPPLLGVVGTWTIDLLSAHPDAPWARLGVCAAAAALLLVPATLFGSAGLPWLVHVVAPTPDKVGRGTGRLLAWNTGGSAVCALATALLWIPGVGTAAVLRGAGGLYFAAAGLAGRGATRLGAFVVAALLLLQPVLMPLEDRALLDALGASFAPDAYAPADAPRIYAREGPLATVVVREREGDPELWVDAKIVASVAPTDRLHLALLGHLPMALHPAPRRTAVVGLGTGITSQAVAAWKPEVLDVFEIEPAVQAACELFRAHAGGVPEAARLVFEDGRTGIARGDVPYDVITCDPIHPAVAGSAALYSKEYYEVLRERGTLVCQWLPLYQMDRADVRLVVRTFAAVFEHPYVFLAGGDALLIGVREPLALDEDALRARLARPGAAGLDAFGMRQPGHLLGLLTKGPAGTRRFAREGPLNVDDRMILEFRCGRNIAARETATNARYLRVGREDPRSVLAASPSEAFERELAEAAQMRTAIRVWLDAEYERAAGEIELVRERFPNADFWVDLHRGTLLETGWIAVGYGHVEEARGIARRVLAGDAVSGRHRLHAADLLIETGALKEGRAIAAELAASEGWPRAIRLAGGRP